MEPLWKLQKQRDMGRRGYNGSITVFFSLTFLLILGAVLSILESSRVFAVKSTTEMALTNAMDSTMADFYLPLFEEYGLYGRTMEEATEEAKAETLTDELTDWLSYYEQPGKNVETLNTSYSNLLQFMSTEVTAGNLEYLCDEDGEQFYQQAIDAIQVFETTDAVDSLLAKCDLVEKTTNAGKAFEMQSDVLEELSTIDETVLQLMTLIDGVTFDGYALKLNQDGTIKVKDTIVKQYVAFPTSKESTEINHDLVYQSTASNFINKDTVYETLLTQLDQYEETQKEIVQKEEEQQELEATIEEINVSIRPYQSQLAACEQTLPRLYVQYAALVINPLSDKDRIKALEDRIRELEMRISSLEAQISQLSASLVEKKEQLKTIKSEVKELESKLKSLSKSISSQNDTIEAQVTKVLEKLEETASVLQAGIVKQQSVSESVDSYGESLEDQKSSLSEELYNSLVEEFNTFTGYTNQTSDESLYQYDFDGMLAIVLYDQALLESRFQKIGSITLSGDSVQLTGYRQVMEQNQRILSQYRIDGLAFDYSNLQTATKPWSVSGMLADLLDNGILTMLVEDTDSISDNELSAYDLVSTSLGQGKNAVQNASEQTIIDTIKNMLTNNVIGDLGSSILEGSKDGTLLATLSEDVTSRVLFQLYVNEYFKSYQIPEEPKVETVLYPSRLCYEKEYLCFGQTSDRENLCSMIYRLVLIRLIFNFISLFSDPVCNQKAQAGAMSLVAFTGMAVLVAITKMVILLAWAFEEAMVDTAILLSGKKLSLVPDQIRHISYEELLLFTPTLIQNKVKAYTDPTSKTAMSYDTYLLLFLCFQSRKDLVYGSMDLIQENMRLRYEDSFRLTNCMTGYKAGLSYQIENVFAIGYEYQLICHKELKASY